MADKDAATPRVFLIRHGETEWSRSGRYTGISDIPLLPSGEDKVRQTASVVFGPNRLIQPRKLGRIFCSPRQRATRTLELLLQSSSSPSSLSQTSQPSSDQQNQKQQQEEEDLLAEKVIRTEDIAEWGYGDYEGLLTKEIRELRHSRGHDVDSEWDIWRDGTEGVGGEAPAEVCARLDRVIEQITTLQGDALRKQHGHAHQHQGSSTADCDVLVVAHGHILRAFVKRWLRLPLDSKVEMMLEPGGVCGLSYAHSNVEERAVLVGMSFPGNP